MNRKKMVRQPDRQDNIIDLLIEKGIIMREELARKAEMIYPCDDEGHEKFTYIQEALVDLLEQKGIISTSDRDGMRGTH